MYTLDTNAIIYYLKDDSNSVSVLENIFKSDASLYISTVTEVELFSLSGISDFEKTQIENILKTLSIISLDSRIARIAGSLRQIYKMKTADSVIAATALFTGSTLITRNVKDFKKVLNLKIKEI